MSAPEAMSAEAFAEEGAEAGAGRDFDCAAAGGDCDRTALWVSRAPAAAIVQRTQRFVIMKFAAFLLSAC